MVTRAALAAGVLMALAVSATGCSHIQAGAGSGTNDASDAWVVRVHDDSGGVKSVHYCHSVTRRCMRAQLR